MAEQRIKGQAAINEYFKRNPKGEGVKVLKGSKELAKMLPSQITSSQPKSKGLFGSIIKGITDPFVNSGRGLLELGNYIGGGPKGQYLTKEELEDPLGFALKNAAGVGS